MNNIEELLQEPWITLLQFLPHQKPFQLKRGCKYRKLLDQSGVTCDLSTTGPDLFWININNFSFGFKVNNVGKMMMGYYDQAKPGQRMIIICLNIETFQQAIDMIHNPNFEQLKAFL